MDTLSNSTPHYSLGYSAEFIGFLRGLAEREFRYVSPYLEPGMRVLDVGCGPGFLSVLLAQGQLLGIDIEPTQVEIARATGQRSGCDNASFQLADAVDLPSEDDQYDLVHAGGLLLHLPDTARALGEMHRVLRPGGTIVCRELLPDAVFVHPDRRQLLKRGLQIFTDLVAADDGHPHIALALKPSLRRAGFDEIELTASFDVYDTPKRIDVFATLIERWFLGGDLGRWAQSYGAASDDLLAEVSRELGAWRRNPDALAGLAVATAAATKS
ncbi:MAG: class I SAM-dependent methyltransferase [bacterium]|nr:class I SAM-dependent methyltransferase [bacterium]